MKKLYKTAKKFLISEIQIIKANVILDSYLNLPDQSNIPVDMQELFRRLLGSAQNANMKTGVIASEEGQPPMSHTSYAYRNERL